MKKILVCFVALLTMILLVNNGVNATSGETNNNVVDELNTLVTSYYNNGVYTKNTEIFLTENAVNELNEHSGFHAGASDLVRLTRYNGDTLTMTIPGKNTYESNYGTDENGNLTHWGKGGTPSIAVKKPTSAENAGLWRNWEEDGMEGYYWTLKDIVATEDHSWTEESGVYTSKDATVIEWFKAFVAPCYIGFQDNTINYITLDSVSIEEVDHTLVLSLYTDSLNIAKLTSNTTLFAQAVVRSGYTYFLTESTVASEKLDGEGTKESPYLIKNDADLLYFKHSVDGGTNYKGQYVELVNNIDVAGHSNFMIGNYFSSSNRKAFSGHLNGGRHLVSGLNINNTEKTNYATGLFAQLDSNGSISNLTVAGTVVGLENVGAISGRIAGTVTNCINHADVTGNTKVGGISGIYDSGLVENCVNYGNVTGKVTVGGVVSYLGAAATNNANYGTVTGSENVGGISGIYGYSGHVGKQDYALTNSANYGAVVGINLDGTNNKNFGGIVGFAYMSVDSCANEGTISIATGLTNIGGIVGIIDGTGVSINNCVNNADIDKADVPYIGGIVGNINKTAVIYNCKNTGNLTGERNIAGIAGAVYENVTGTVIESCENRGSITGTYQVAGIVGYIYGPSTTVSKCDNYGDVTGTGSNNESVGGIVGRTNDPGADLQNVIEYCNNNGVVTGAGIKYVGGIVGCLGSNSSIVDSHNTAAVSGKTLVGGISGTMYSNSNITGSSNSGSVTATSTYVGGLVGYSNSTSVGSVLQNCSNSGVVTSSMASGKVYAGLFVGGASSTSYITVSGNNNTGSLVVKSGVSSYSNEKGGVTSKNATFDNNTGV